MDRFEQEKAALIEAARSWYCYPQTEIERLKGAVKALLHAEAVAAGFTGERDHAEYQRLAKEADVRWKERMRAVKPEEPTNAQE